jgi:hypothetical protein
MLDRIIAFTDIDIAGLHASMLTLVRDSIDVLEQQMPIVVITDWEVSIRPCEFNNFARLLGRSISVRTNSSEYRYLMDWLTTNAESLLELMDLSEGGYAALREAGAEGAAHPLIFPVLDHARRIIRSAASGRNVLRYLMLRMHNQTLKLQFSRDRCDLLSQLKLEYGCIPFDTMPFCTSLPGHNPRYWDLAESIDVTGRTHELLARRV